MTELQSEAERWQQRSSTGMFPLVVLWLPMLGQGSRSLDAASVLAAVTMLMDGLVIANMPTPAHVT